MTSTGMKNLVHPEAIVRNAIKETGITISRTTARLGIARNTFVSARNLIPCLPPQMRSEDDGHPGPGSYAVCALTRPNPTHSLIDPVRRVCLYSWTSMAEIPDSLYI